MQVQVNTDANVDGRDALTHYVEEKIRAALERFGDQVTTVEVHLSDENGAKTGGDDKRCLIEARLAARQPVVASSDGATLEDALSGAAKKLQRLLESALGRSSDHKGAASIRTESDT
jgi:ribosomal subunit interface protein